jgi:hypothetical protein
VVSDDEDDDEVETRPIAPSGFIPAENKFEVVNRISRIAGGGREILGPGSKERKSVLLRLARVLSLPEPLLRLNKPALAKEIADRLRQPWDRDCWSTGSTVTLTGLNRLLEGAHPVRVAVPEGRLASHSLGRQVPAIAGVARVHPERTLSGSRAGLRQDMVQGKPCGRLVWIWLLRAFGHGSSSLKVD